MKINDTIVNFRTILKQGTVAGYNQSDMWWRVTAVSNDSILAHPWGEPENERAITQEDMVTYFRK
jgi:hypothetical protein